MDISIFEDIRLNARKLREKNDQFQSMTMGEKFHFLNSGETIFNGLHLRSMEFFGYVASFSGKKTKTPLLLDYDLASECLADLLPLSIRFGQLNASKELFDVLTGFPRSDIVDQNAIDSGIFWASGMTTKSDLNKYLSDFLALYDRISGKAERVPPYLDTGVKTLEKFAEFRDFDKAKKVLGKIRELYDASSSEDNPKLKLPMIRANYHLTRNLVMHDLSKEAFGFYLSMEEYRGGTPEDEELIDELIVSAGLSFGYPVKTKLSKDKNAILLDKLIPKEGEDPESLLKRADIFIKFLRNNKNNDESGVNINTFILELFKKFPHQDLLDAQMVEATASLAEQHFFCYDEILRDSLVWPVWPLLSSVADKAKKGGAPYARLVDSAMLIICQLIESGTRDEADNRFRWVRDLASSDEDLLYFLRIFSEYVSMLLDNEEYALVESLLNLFDVHSFDARIQNSFYILNLTAIQNSSSGGRKPSIEKVLDALPAEGLPPELTELRTLTIIIILGNYIINGQSKQALDLWKKHAVLDKTGEDSLRWLQASLFLTESFAKKPKTWNLALKVFDTCLAEAPDDEKSLLPVFHMATELTQGYLINQDFPSVLDLLSRLPEVPVTPNLAQARYEIIFLVVSNIFKHKDFDEALTFFFTNFPIPQDFTPFALPYAKLADWLVFNLCSMGRLAEAEELNFRVKSLKFAKGDKTGDEILAGSAGSLALALLESGKADRALSLLEGLRRPPKGKIPRRLSQAALALREHFLQKNEPKKAQKLSPFIRGEG
jgi:hypothetical protein